MMTSQIMNDIWASIDNSNPNVPREEITQQLDFVTKETQEVYKGLLQIKQEHEAIALQCEGKMKKQSTKDTLKHFLDQFQPFECENQSLQKKMFHAEDVVEENNFVTIEAILNEKVTFIRHLFFLYAKKMKDILSMVEKVQSNVLFEQLLRWKREQQLQGNGANKLTSNLNKIQEWCEKLVDILWSIRQQLKQAGLLQKHFIFNVREENDFIPIIERKSTELLSSLITSTFVIEKQPQQVIKTNTRITAVVRLLVGAKLNIYVNPPKVTVTIINEEQARALLNTKRKFDQEISGDISENYGVMEFSDSRRSLSVNFKNSRLKKIKRSEKKGADCVTDEKFSLLFQSQFPVGDDLVFQVWTLSLPVVVVVHGSQDPNAWATVTWDNAFAKLGRVPFTVPEHVAWESVAAALKMKFRGVTGCALPDESLHFLAEKVFGYPAKNYNRMVVSFFRLCKDPLPLRSFSFWEWFYGVMKLTKDHLRDLWLDGHIMGFVRKKDAEEMLTFCPKGTFLLRFSDSELGGITIAWVGDRKEVFMLQPFTSKDFAVRSLPDRLLDLQHLTFLYLQIPKDIAFGKYYTPFDGNPPVNGYVKPLLVTQVPGLSCASPSSSFSCSHKSLNLQGSSFLDESFSDTSTNKSFESLLGC